MVETYCFSAVYCCYYYYYYYYSTIWWRERSPVANFNPIFAKKILNTLWWIILLKFKNQQICIYIQDGSHGLICIFKIDIHRERSPVANFYPMVAKFFLNTLWLIILLEFENQLICIYPRRQPWVNLHILDRRERSPVVNIHPICTKKLLITLW